MEPVDIIQCICWVAIIGGLLFFIIPFIGEMLFEAVCVFVDKVEYGSRKK